MLLSLLLSLAAYSQPASESLPDSLKDLAKVDISLNQAKMSLRTGGPRKGLLRIEKLRGPEQCLVRTEFAEGVLRLTQAASPESDEGKPDLTECFFEISLQTHRAVEVQIQSEGYFDLEAENWESPLIAKMNRGSVAFGDCGALDVSCQSCDISGDGLNGAFKYDVGIGTIGVMRLSDSVVGSSKGDAILRWRRLRPKANVTVHSRAGDLALSFPPGPGLTLDLAAPRGEIHTKATSSHAGIPVKITAEAGAIRLFTR